ncbi:MAG: preprotein translocase subunit SecY [Candidatus Paceibacterota bacterium]|jgi:preprotein translocase subunit SecY
MNTIFAKLSLIFRDAGIRRRIIFTAGALVVFQLLANIPIPGVDLIRLKSFLSNNQFFGLIDIFSGGGLSTLSIVMLGVGPYITGSIIMQLLTMMIPKLKQMYQEEGELGRKKFAQYSRLLTVPLAVLQGFGFLTLLSRQGILGSVTSFDMLINITVVVAGSILLMWIGELVSEYGIGNGVSIIIFAGIISRLPQMIAQFALSFEMANLPMYLGFAAIALAIIYSVVVITEAERPIPVTYAKRVRGMKVYGGVSTYLPLRLNQAGVIPIIFALSILLFPQMISTFLSGLNNQIFQSIARVIANFLANQWLYAGAYFALVFLFTYFYTAVTFDPDMISTNLQKNGAFIPGVRPGQSTSEHLANTITRLTLVGALFLGVIAVLPLIMKAFTNNSALAIGGTALLIVVSVVIDILKKIDAQVAMREY